MQTSSNSTPAQAPTAAAPNAVHWRSEVTTPAGPPPGWRVIPEQTVTKPAMLMPVGPPSPHEELVTTYRGAPPRHELEAAYNLVPSLVLLSKFYNVAPGTVQRWLLYHRIPRRQPGAGAGKLARANLPKLAQLAKTFTRQPTLPTPVNDAPVNDATDAPTADGNDAPAHPDINFDDDEYVYGELLTVTEQAELEKLHSHWPGCYAHGPQHYKCALAEIARLRTVIDNIKNALVL